MPGRDFPDRLATPNTLRHCHFPADACCCFQLWNVRLRHPRCSNLSTGNITTYSMTEGLYQSCDDIYLPGPLNPYLDVWPPTVIHRPWIKVKCARWSANVFTCFVPHKSGFPLRWIPDISLVNMIKLPCCNVLSTRNRAYVRRVIDSLYCPDPCQRLQLTVLTF